MYNRRYSQVSVSFSLPNETMPLSTSHKRLVVGAKSRTKKLKTNLEKQERTDDEFTFARIGTYVPSEAEKEQFRRLAEIQEKANKAVLDSKARF